jgi:hypothetical protein
MIADRRHGVLDFKFDCHHDNENLPILPLTAAQADLTMKSFLAIETVSH